MPDPYKALVPEEAISEAFKILEWPISPDGWEKAEEFMEARQDAIALLSMLTAPLVAERDELRISRAEQADDAEEARRVAEGLKVRLEEARSRMARLDESIADVEEARDAIRMDPKAESVLAKKDREILRLEQTLEEARGALVGILDWMESVGYDSPGDLEPGRLYAAGRAALQSSDTGEGERLTATGRLNFLYSDEDSDCTCCDGPHCFAYGIQLDGRAMGISGFSEIVSEFARPLRHKDMQRRAVEVAIRVLPEPIDKEGGDRAATGNGPSATESADVTGAASEGSDAASEAFPDRNRSGFLSLLEGWEREALEFRAAAGQAGPETASLLLAKAEVLDEVLAILRERPAIPASVAAMEYAKLETVDPETDRRFAKKAQSGTSGYDEGSSE